MLWNSHMDVFVKIFNNKAKKKTNSRIVWNEIEITSSSSSSSMISFWLHWMCVCVYVVLSVRLISIGNILLLSLLVFFLLMTIPKKIYHIDVLSFFFMDHCASILFNREYKYSIGCRLFVFIWRQCSTVQTRSSVPSEWLKQDCLNVCLIINWTCKYSISRQLRMMIVP